MILFSCQDLVLAFPCNAAHCRVLYNFRMVRLAPNRSAVMKPVLKYEVVA